MQPWYKHNYSAEELLNLAWQSVMDTKHLVDEDARITHVGLRTKTKEDWLNLRAKLVSSGQEFMTYKDDGRHIPFLKLKNPKSDNNHILEYIELPEPKRNPVEEPSLIIAYYHPANHTEPKRAGEYDIRQQKMRAIDYIERDKGK